MALLYRFTKLNDRYNTGIFTFIVTRSVTRDLHRDATTKDFYYGYHRWAISFSRANDKALGVFLLLRNPSPSTKCYADFTLTLLNREHFSRNEQHTEKQCKFTTDHTMQGVSKWIMLSEIQSRKFGDETGEFLLELSLGNMMTIFETDLQVSNNGQLKSGKFESASFSFGSFEWNVSIVIHNYGSTGLSAASTGGQNDSAAETNRIIYVFLNRLSGFDHPCRVQYRMKIGDDKNREDSGVLDQISDAGGRIRGFQMQHSLSDLLKSNGSVRVHVELHCCNAISEAKVPIVRNPSPTINCYDRNKQGWCIEADLDSEYLRLKLFFMDLHSVPRNHLRYISWIAYVIAKDPRNNIRESIAVANAPHSNYYIQDGIDMGAMMDTTLPVSKIKESPKIYLESEKLTVHVEWCDSIMLFNHIYHKYDDITRIHGHQMRREILALSSENFSLEKQLISYQKTIGSVRTRSMSKDHSGPESGPLIKAAGQLNHQRSTSESQLENSVVQPQHEHQQQQQNLLPPSATNPPTNNASTNNYQMPVSNAAAAVHGNALPASQVPQIHSGVEQHSSGRQHHHRASVGDVSMLNVPPNSAPPNIGSSNNNNLTSSHNPMARGQFQRHRSTSEFHHHHQQQQHHRHHHQLPVIPTNQSSAAAAATAAAVAYGSSGMYQTPQAQTTQFNFTPQRLHQHSSLSNNHQQTGTMIAPGGGGGGGGAGDPYCSTEEDYYGLSRSLSSMGLATPTRISRHRSHERNYPPMTSNYRTPSLPTPSVRNPYSSRLSHQTAHAAAAQQQYFTTTGPISGYGATPPPLPQQPPMMNMDSANGWINNVSVTPTSKLLYASHQHGSGGGGSGANYYM